ncbi:MAG TPA: hypothetical protein VMT62_00705 [Syntrophorhabdaceae bacterium]|nr:hypothetical protein [Syntrophorhabdaceae bacterium]
MKDFTIHRKCANCRGYYEMKLRDIRRDFKNSCPVCGHSNSVSENQAARAQRLLERLEEKQRVTHTA